jgi:hypothetical protein
VAVLSGEHPIDDVIRAIEAHTGRQGRRQGRNTRLVCPAHEDRTPSLDVAEGDDGQVLLACRAGCEAEAIVAEVGLELHDLFPSSGEGGRGSYPRRARSTVHPLAGGLTLERYAEAKRLPVAFLRTLGVTEFHYAGEPSVRIPYYADDGTEAAVRFRLRVERSADADDRFLWRKGSKLLLYGISRLTRARELGYVVLVEGESDCQTLWHHQLPGVGLPGASQWNEARDAPVLDGVDVVYVVLEPDRGGEALLAKLSRSRIRNRLRLVRLETKDVSELHLAGEEQFVERFEAALRQALPWAEHERVQTDLRRVTSWAECEALATQPRILDRFLADLRDVGVVGEQKTAATLYLGLTSRLFTKPVSLAVKGLSSAGKSHLVECVLAFFPDSAFYELTSMSDRALAYLEEPLSHRHLVVFEAAGLESEFASYLLRSLLSEGRIRYQVVEKTGQGMRGRLIEIEGPIGVLLTTTEVELHRENETRLLSLTVTDTPEQTRQVLLAIAAEEAGAGIPAGWHALQQWLEAGPTRVTIPYAKELAELVPPVAVRLRRDFGALLELVRAHALLNQANRKLDAQGRIVADLDDYAVVRELVRGVIAEAVDVTVSVTVRETVTTVAQIIADGKHSGGVMVAELAGKLGLDKSAASRRARRAREKGYLKNLESRRGRPACYLLANPLPEELELLPTVATLRERLRGEPLANAIDQPEPEPNELF